MVLRLPNTFYLKISATLDCCVLIVAFGFVYLVLRLPNIFNLKIGATRHCYVLIIAFVFVYLVLRLPNVDHLKSMHHSDRCALFVTFELCASRKLHTYSRVGGIEMTHYSQSSHELTYNFTRNSHKRHINHRGLVIEEELEEVEWAKSAIVLTRSDD